MPQPHRPVAPWPSLCHGHGHGHQSVPPHCRYHHCSHVSIGPLPHEGREAHEAGGA